jgi:TPR repeat protein
VRLSFAALLAAVLAASCARSADQLQCKLKTQGDHGPNEGAYQVCVSQKDYERGLAERHERDVEACAAGARPECLRAGLRDEAGDRPRALREYEAACGDDLPNACYRAALLLRESARLMTRTPPDGFPPKAEAVREADRRLVRAQRYLEQACRMKWQGACDELVRSPLAP